MIHERARGAPQLRLFPRWRGASKFLRGPAFGVGDCLEPWLPDGSRVWYDLGLDVRFGDLVQVFDPAARSWQTKLLDRKRDGTPFLCNNVGAYSLAGRIVAGVVVAAIIYPPGWRNPFHEHTARVNAENAWQRERIAREHPHEPAIVRSLLARAFGQSERPPAQTS